MREYEPEEIERGRLLFAGGVTFRMGVASLSQLPPAYPLEVAFAGRSNVGKSSLLNALTGRKDIARTSNTPGRTRELNYFEVGEGQVALVDMPGYGYARAQKSLVKSWQSIIMGYLQGRPNLRRVFVLIDSRHGIKANDIETLDQLDEAAVNYHIVLTKADKLKAAERDKVLAATAKAIARRPAAFPDVIITSSEKGWGIPELRAEIAGMLG
ncbi:MAG: ribosome biogenesis GTP-binding protein YihA/YsxC [Anderseniella sp.]|jgi:GTP-binding protein|nr:ribosome biogenesis GTP-binding protein YihA/YsxC [Anderseniella sp.]